MGRYTTKQLLNLERTLHAQHEAKAYARTKGNSEPASALSAEAIGSKLGINPAYVRGFAFERSLDPFPGQPGAETSRLLIDLVVFRGFSVKQAALLLHIKHASAQAYLNRAGYTQYVLWGKRHAGEDVVVIPKPLAAHTFARKMKGWTDGQATDTGA